jgi:dienelactone hydrolase
MRINSLITCTLLILGAISATTFAAESDFETLGPYAVGVTTTILVDANRDDASTKSARTLPTEIWYPTTDLGKQFPKNKHSDFLFSSNPAMKLALKMAFDVDVSDFDDQFENTAFRDAPVADGKFPLIIFSHGNGGFRMQNVFWCEHLASHGYIVVAPDHTGNSAATIINGLLVPYNNDRIQAAKDRPLDVSFLIDQMDIWNKGGDSRFAKKLDMDKIGVGGHSFGGFTSTWVAEIDDRVDAIVPMAGAAPDIKTPNHTPLMVIMATEDDTIGLRGNEVIRNYYETSTGPKYFIEFMDGGHYSFTEMFQYRPNFGDGIGTGKRITKEEDVTFTPKEIIYQFTNGYSLAFLNKHVKGDTDPAIDKYLTKNQDKKSFMHKFNIPKVEEATTAK